MERPEILLYKYKKHFLLWMIIAIGRKEKTVLVRERGPEPRDLLLFHQMIDSFHSVSLEDLNVKEKEKRKQKK